MWPQQINHCCHSRRCDLFSSLVVTVWQPVHACCNGSLTKPAELEANTILQLLQSRVGANRSERRLLIAARPSLWTWRHHSIAVDYSKQQQQTSQPVCLHRQQICHRLRNQGLQRTVSMFHYSSFIFHSFYFLGFSVCLGANNNITSPVINDKLYHLRYYLKLNKTWKWSETSFLQKKPSNLIYDQWQSQ